MKVLVACEFSGVVRDAFIAEGHDAISCDLLPTESPGPHIQGDVRPLLREPWDLVIAHPPCTYLSHLNVLYGHNKKPHFAERMAQAIEFFLLCLNANSPHSVVENPTMLTAARLVIGEPDDVVQPYQFGDWAKKRTCLWLRNVPPLMRTYIGSGPSSVTLRSALKRAGDNSTNAGTTDPADHRGRKHRNSERSRFWPGIAAAMAKQWGGYS